MKISQERSPVFFAGKDVTFLSLHHGQFFRKCFLKGLPMEIYVRPFLIVPSEAFPLIKTQGSQFELLCHADLECDVARGGVCCVANEGLSIRLGIEAPCSVQAVCVFQTLGEALNCDNVTLTPLGACGDLCVWDMTCEEFSGPCPAENTVSALCEEPGT
jgi:hypothetical protein